LELAIEEQNCPHSPPLGLCAAYRNGLRMVFGANGEDLKPRLAKKT
jgi:hypothetical protein